MKGLQNSPENNALGSVFRTFERFDALIQITEEARHATALADALRQLALGDLLLAKGALLNHALLLVQVTNV